MAKKTEMRESVIDKELPDELEFGAYESSSPTRQPQSIAI